MPVVFFVLCALPVLISEVFANDFGEVTWLRRHTSAACAVQELATQNLMMQRL